MLKKILLSLFIVFLIISTSFQSVSLAESSFQPPSEDWNSLQDYILFEGNRDGWGYGLLPGEDSGWGYDYFIPLGEEYNGAPSIQLTPTDDFWEANLTLNGWQTGNIEPYLANGSLQFAVKGEDGGEGFQLGFKDSVTERFYNGEPYEPEHGAESNVHISLDSHDYFDITTDWQTIEIPLAEFIDDGLFDFSRVQLFTLSRSYQTTENEFTAYISDIKIVSDDIEESFAPIKVNQLGYLIDGEKYAYVSGYYNELTATVGTPFEVKNSANDQVVYSGELELVKAYDPASGEKVLKADFSNVEEGRFYISIDGEEDSSVFAIGTEVYNQLLTDVQRFYFLQRANVDLLEEHAGIFAREMIHDGDFAAPLQTDPSTTIDVAGGWYDAGDYGKYVTAAATAVSDLLWAYELYDEAFYDGQLNIPESNNGTPDLLDEIKFETDFLLKMQDDETGGFYSYVIRDEDRTVMNASIPTAQTANTAGALAHTSLVFSEFDHLEDYAATLLASAEAAWEYLEDNPTHIPQPDGPYNVDHDENSRYYAAAALYRATGEQKYSQYILDHYQDFPDTFGDASFSHGINGMEMIGHHHYMAAHETDSSFEQWYTEQFNSWRNEVIHISTSESVWRNSPNEYYWGANTNTFTTPLSLAVGSQLTDQYDEDVLHVSAANMNYVLGINPLQLSFVTGFGENHIHETHSSIFNSDWLVEFPPGFMAGGPNSSSTKLSNFPAKRYNHSTIDWETNEHAINYNSPLVFVAAMLVYHQDHSIDEIENEEEEPAEEEKEEPSTEEKDDEKKDPPGGEPPADDGTLTDDKDDLHNEIPTKEEIETIISSQSGSPLPNTATNTYNHLLIGLLIVAIGLTTRFRNRVLPS
ncbi:glycoside hydrolase family 9 protein [Halalkalibacter sp. APA_J-10(15)]|uniref:glycoside hydrolase family 9 protein n=1 Tax=Halalkalibacter sp. APA_J-10(15) TaxID=2933805 RepID=UPI001FF63B15|nr:glycoside hydrolase family 9 protein [Halalkalibacter sp. APA_J-10(15)]MCK0472425.1 glycoside hydrolase family 9 protein [Halalkalibacter sp. APA_J-10(15)]